PAKISKTEEFLLIEVTSRNHPVCCRALMRFVGWNGFIPRSEYSTSTPLRLPSKTSTNTLSHSSMRQALPRLLPSWLVASPQSPSCCFDPYGSVARQTATASQFTLNHR